MSPGEPDELAVGRSIPIGRNQRLGRLVVAHPGGLERIADVKRRHVAENLIVSCDRLRTDANVATFGRQRNRKNGLRDDGFDRDLDVSRQSGIIGEVARRNGQIVGWQRLQKLDAADPNGLTNPGAGHGIGNQILDRCLLPE